MELPYRLKSAIEKKAIEIPHVKLLKCAESITDMYKKESGQGKRLVQDDDTTVTYAVVRMPATYGAVSSALNHTLEQFEGRLESLLDVGAGTCAATWATVELIDELQDITCLEREPSMIKFAKELMKESNFNQYVNWINSDICSFTPHRKYDLVIASYSLNELSTKDRELVVKKLWDCTEKILLIVEPGTPVAFKQIKRARDILIEEGANVVAPCPSSKKCPIMQDDWCHFSCRIARTKLHKLLKGGDAPYEDEKYSYVAFTRDMIKSSDRILRHPIIESGRVTLKLCTEKGIVQKSITKKQKDQYKIARKAKCGDSF